MGSLLNAAGQRLGAELDSALTDAGFEDLRSAHAPVFMAIDPAGTRLTDLAFRTSMTKQAVGELIRYLEQCGYVTVQPDDQDGRAKRVRLTRRGWAAIDLGERVIADFDAWLDALFGSEQVTALRQILVRIVTTDPSQRGRPVTGGAVRVREADG